MGDAEFSLRRIAVPAFGPTALWSVGIGAVLPVIALSARDLGASVSVAALFVGIGTVSELVSAVPAGVVVDRLGERRALVLAGLADAAASLLALLAPSLWVLALAVVLTGPTGAVFLLARQSFLTAAAPVHLRARAMSTLGGVARIGLFVGPFIGAPLVAVFSPQAAFGVAVAGGLAAAALAAASPDLGAHGPGPGDAARVDRVPVREVARRHRAVLLTVGVGVLAIGLARSSRVVVVPLWAEHVGLTAAQTSLVFGVAGLVEVLLFYPAGSLMDRCGRIWVALPVTVLLGIGLLVLPLTSTLLAVGAVAVVMAVGNGLGSGIVMTLGADAAPEQGRAPFLGLWRLLSLVGHNGASIVVGALAAVASIGAASVTVGVLTVAGGAWLLRWLPRYEPER
ncbi:MFS transporter [Phycicoccus sp. MAQZ13P-2]|uniref:MFS transporter n=1 Tax=Phycicoccus mangrovi TaxID=2840470 RepID=UPI001C0015EA|nr:MFS transporter [Phycicoccus mangrovi]MBT9255070.1 MFS transporter [Phycicoccus mangrovi]MBT9274054.1 MFS transporter [Phycicoccus mangrovi]